MYCDILKTSGRYAAASLQLTLTLNPNFFCTHNALFATANKHTAKCHVRDVQGHIHTYIHILFKRPKASIK